MKQSTFTLSILFSLFLMLFSTNVAQAQAQCCCDLGSIDFCVTFNAAGIDCNGSCINSGFTNAGSVTPYPDNATCMASCGAVVPIELTLFTAKANREGVVEIKWTTASETDNKGFEIQRMDGIGLSWETLGFVDGQGTSFQTQEYTFYDENPPLGVNYYRLEQIDFSGATTISQIESVNQDPKAVFSVWPTVAHDRVVLMINDDYQNEDIVVQVRDLNGKLLVELPRYNRVIDTEFFSPGHYLVSFYVNGQMYTQQFIKAN